MKAVGCRDEDLHLGVEGSSALYQGGQCGGRCPAPVQSPRSVWGAEADLARDSRSHSTVTVTEQPLWSGPGPGMLFKSIFNK